MSRRTRAASPPEGPLVRSPSNAPFVACLMILGGTYLLLIVLLLAAQFWRMSPSYLLEVLHDPKIQYAARLSLISCTLTTLLSLWVAVPLGYLMSRFQFRGKEVIDLLIDIPIVLPPLVVGLALLILFQSPLGQIVERRVPITFAIPSVVLAQFVISCALAVRTMRVAFDQIDVRTEQVAWTLGASRGQAFWTIVLPQARRGLLTAATLAWARALGEFGPVLMFSGTTRLRTEVLPTSIFLEMSIGNLEGALAISMLMVLAAAVVLLITRWFGLRNSGLI